MGFRIVQLLERADVKSCVSFYASRLHQAYLGSLRSIFEMLPSQYRSPLLGGIGLMSVASVTTAAAVPNVVPFEWQNTKHL